MTISGGTTGRPRAAYAGIMILMSRAGRAARRAGPVAREAGRGLLQVLFGADPPPVWRSPWQRRAVHVGLGAATLVLAAASLISLTGVTSYLYQAGGISIVGAHRQVVVSKVVNPVGLHFAQAAAGFGGTPFTWSFAPGPMSVALAMALAVLAAVAVVAPLPLAARYPLMGWRLAWLGLLAVPLTGANWLGNWPWGPVQILVLLTVFCAAGVRHPRALLCWMWALTLIPWCLWAAPHRLGCALGAVAFTAAAVAVDSMSSRRRAQQALADQTERTELEQARRAVLEERAKIARELHDVVAHHMSLIAVRAETAPYRLPGLPAAVQAEFGSLSEAAREALTDMRRLLGVLRNDEPAARAPQPRLSDLPVLIDAARQAGVPVRLTAPPALTQVPSGVGVCAYRIVQESLSNASRHAPGAAVTVSVDQAPDTVLLRVANGPGEPSGHAGHAGDGMRGAGAADGGPGRPAADGPGPGHGLAGMRERVALLGGSFTAGPAPGGGFVVSAVLPTGQAA
jgi:signal transduction histidine kinase